MQFEGSFFVILFLLITPFLFSGCNQRRAAYTESRRNPPKCFFFKSIFDLLVELRSSDVLTPSQAEPRASTRPTQLAPILFYNLQQFVREAPEGLIRF